MDREAFVVAGKVEGFADDTQKLVRVGNVLVLVCGSEGAFLPLKIAVRTTTSPSWGALYANARSSAPFTAHASA